MRESFSGFKGGTGGRDHFSQVDWFSGPTPGMRICKRWQGEREREISEEKGLHRRDVSTLIVLAVSVSSAFHLNLIQHGQRSSKIRRIIIVHVIPGREREAGWKVYGSRRQQDWADGSSEVKGHLGFLPGGPLDPNCRLFGSINLLFAWEKTKRNVRCK